MNAPIFERYRLPALFFVAMVIALAIGWPLLLDSYQIGLGGGEGEVGMGFGIKMMFNNYLRAGIFPLWNQWVESGKVFLPLGSSALHLFTPLEVLFGDSLRLYKLEIIADIAIVAAGWMLFARAAGFAWWLGIGAFCIYFLEWSFPAWISWNWLQRGLFIAPTFMILAMMYAIKTGKRSYAVTVEYLTG